MNIDDVQLIARSAATVARMQGNVSKGPICDDGIAGLPMGKLAGLCRISRITEVIDKCTDIGTQEEFILERKDGFQVISCKKAGDQYRFTFVGYVNRSQRCLLYTSDAADE